MGFTYLLAIPLSVIFEAPFLGLEKLVFGQRGNKNSKFDKIWDTFKIWTGINSESSKEYLDNDLSKIDEQTYEDSNYEERK